jgi:hypothetical protein
LVNKDQKDPVMQQCNSLQHQTGVGMFARTAGGQMKFVNFADLRRYRGSGEAWARSIFNRR